MPDGVVVTRQGIGRWFSTTVGVRQKGLLPPVLLNIFLEKYLKNPSQTDRSG